MQIVRGPLVKFGKQQLRCPVSRLRIEAAAGGRYASLDMSRARVCPTVSHFLLKPNLEVSGDRVVPSCKLSEPSDVGSAASGRLG